MKKYEEEKCRTAAARREVGNSKSGGSDKPAMGRMEEVQVIIFFLSFLRFDLMCSVLRTQGKWRNGAEIGRVMFPTNNLTGRSLTGLVYRLSQRRVGIGYRGESSGFSALPSL